MSVVKVKKDLIGQKYGRLTVIDRAEDYISPSGDHVACWLCKCDCGNEKVVKGSSLKRGNTKSCGCLAREISSESLRKRNKKENKYKFNGEIGECYFNNCDEYFLFDTEDYEKIKNTSWCKNGGGYATGGIVGQGVVLIHRFLMNCPKDMQVDHINHNKLDNRKCNLRICTPAQNCWNNGMCKNNITGYKGVHKCIYNSGNVRYEASITVNKKTIRLGRFDTPEEAYIARSEAEEKYFGDFRQKEGV